MERGEHARGREMSSVYQERVTFHSHLPLSMVVSMAGGGEPPRVVSYRSGRRRVFHRNPGSPLGFGSTSAAAVSLPLRLVRESRRTLPSHTRWPPVAPPPPCLPFPRRRRPQAALRGEPSRRRAEGQDGTPSWKRPSQRRGWVSAAAAEASERGLHRPAFGPSRCTARSSGRGGPVRSAWRYGARTIKKMQ